MWPIRIKLIVRKITFYAPPNGRKSGRQTFSTEHKQAEKEEKEKCLQNPPIIVHVSLSFETYSLVLGITYVNGNSVISFLEGESENFWMERSSLFCGWVHSKLSTSNAILEIFSIDILESGLWQMAFIDLKCRY